MGQPRTGYRGQEGHGRQGRDGRCSECRHTQPTPLARLPALLAISCLGTVTALVAGRALLLLQPPLTPDTPTGELERVHRWSMDPERRREASLLLHARLVEAPQQRRLLLRNQGWGRDPLAAVVLKLQALDAEALQRADLAIPLWQELLQRFPAEPPSADALYTLGRQAPALRQRLLRDAPAHPAALAAALEGGPAPQQRLEGTLHLAHWGARWPGAEQRLRQSCRRQGVPLQPAQRALLARGLAELGDGQAALACLEGPGQARAALGPPGQLTLARSLLQGPPALQQQATSLLLQVAGASPKAGGPQAEEAVRLLAQQSGPAAAERLKQLPAPWRATAPVRARQLLNRLEASPPTPAPPATLDREGLTLFQRWPNDAASWDLQWELARRRLLAGQWPAAQTVLRAIPTHHLPAPLAARQLFWLGYSQNQLGQTAAAKASWKQLLRQHPGGYYGWRAAVQLGDAGPSPAAGAPPPRPSAWQPLASGVATLDRLWRLDQRTEAWEAWRMLRAGQPAQGSATLLVEGRLRQGVGDDWTGFSQLERASLELPAAQCALAPLLERSLHPPRFLSTFQPVARQHQLPLALLLAVAKQESRVTPSIHSVAGAVGLLQLMPDTAAELAGRPLSTQELEQPRRNADLGGRYLRQLLDQWGGDPILAVASYNAGAEAVKGWLHPGWQGTPELWVEAIPYPETRLYVKKVLGNAWSYQQPRHPGC